jgi:RimJ/RimL family protein N-acetyltransferase
MELKLPTLASERIILSALKVADIPTIVSYAGDEKIAATTSNLPHPYFEKDAIFWLNMANQGFQDKSKYIFAIRLKETEEFIGGIGLHIMDGFKLAEFGYWVAVPFWNHGYATEALKLLLKFGFEELGLNKIYAIHLEHNPASGRVMKKNKMIEEGKLIAHVRKNEEYLNVIQYRLTAAEYKHIF